MPEADDATAYKWLQDKLRLLKEGVVKVQSPKVPFSSYAVSVLERKIKNGDLRSASTIENGRTPSGSFEGGLKMKKTGRVSFPNRPFLLSFLRGRSRA